MPYNPGIQARPFHADMSGWGRALMSMLGDQKAERTERDSLIERYGGKAGQEGVPSAPIYGQIGGDYGSMEGPNEGTTEGGATDEMKAQAKSAKAFRDLGQHLYGYSREELSTKSLGELRGLARKEESAIVQQEKTQARQDRLAQFAEVQKQHQIVNDQNWARDMSAAGQRVSDNIWRMGQDNLANKRLSMDEQNSANLQEARRAKLESDTLMAGNLANFQRLAGEPTGPSRMGGDAAAALLSQPGTRLPDFSRYGPQDTQLTRQPLSLDRVLELGTQTGAAFHPDFKDYAKLYQGAKLDPIGQMNAEAAWLNAQTGATEAARRATNGEAGKALPEPRDGYAALPDGRGGFTWKAQKKADGTVSAAIPAEMQTKMDTLLNEITEDEAQIAAGDTRSWYGGSRADRLKENKARLAVFQRNYGGAAAPGPASGGSRFKVEEIK